MTNQTWFSRRVRHPARKWRGLFLQTCSLHVAFIYILIMLSWLLRYTCC